MRLVAALAMEQSEEWETGRQYLDASLLEGWSFEEEDPENRPVDDWPFDEPSGDLALVKK